MRVTSDAKEWQVVVRLDNTAEEPAYVYDLVESGRLQVENREYLPLPFRGRFLFKLPERPRPIEIQIGRFECTPSEIAAGEGQLRLLVACPKGSPELFAEIEHALREVPPASQEEFQSDRVDSITEFDRIRKMNFARKVIYATRAGQSGRTVLMQQPTPLLLLYLIKNPLITLPEVIAIARMPSIDALVAETIVKTLRGNPQWAMSEELKLSIAMNAKTPGGTAISLLRHLNAKSLRKVTKSDVGSSVKNAALKLLLERKD